jgi:hypothetical protein
LRGHQLVGLGIFFPSTSTAFFIGGLKMMLQERVAIKMMLFGIKDWDSFQLVMRLWRRGEML